MTAPVTLTAAQERALDWLPGDGRDRDLIAAIYDAPDRGVMRRLRMKGLAQSTVGSGDFVWRLTPAGLALKAERARAE